MPSAIVAGAGIAGLTAALALARRSWTVQVHERAGSLDPVGAGIQLSPNALDVLRELGLGEAIGVVGVAADRVVLRDGRSGRRIAEVPVSSSDGRGYRVLHRAELQRILLQAVHAQDRVSLQLGASLTGLARSGHGIRASFEGDSSPFSITADLLVAADGVRSQAARLLGFPDPTPSGAVALRFSPPLDAHSATGGAIEAWLGPKRHAVRYTIDEAGHQNLVVIVPESDPTPDRILTWDPRLAEAIRESRPLGSWPMATVTPRWSDPGRLPVAFVGDAAHAMLPYAAQGAGMAIEDAWVLACCLGNSRETSAALALYADLRAPRLRRVLERVAFHRRVYHLPRPLSFCRDLALAIRSPASLRSDLGWLYDWRASDL